MSAILNAIGDTATFAYTPSETLIITYKRVGKSQNFGPNHFQRNT